MTPVSTQVNGLTTITSSSPSGNVVTVTSNVSPYVSSALDLRVAGTTDLANFLVLENSLGTTVVNVSPSFTERMFVAVSFLSHAQLLPMYLSFSVSSATSSFCNN